MTLNNIAIQAAINLRQPVASLTNYSQLGLTNVNLVLPVFNMLRTDAESSNDFEFTYKQVDVTVVPGTPVDLSTAVIHGTTTAAVIKTIMDIGLYDKQGNLWPVEWTSGGESMERTRQENGFGFERYPRDDQNSFRYSSGLYRVIINGGPQGTLDLYPVRLEDGTQSFTFGIMAYLLTPDWTDMATDPVIYGVQGARWLTWATVCELNPIFKAFIARQEGNLGEPSDKRDDAFNKFKEWDLLSIEQHRRHER